MPLEGLIRVRKRFAIASSTLCLFDSRFATALYAPELASSIGSPRVSTSSRSWRMPPGACDSARTGAPSRSSWSRIISASGFLGLGRTDATHCASRCKKVFRVARTGGAGKLSLLPARRRSWRTRCTKTLCDSSSGSGERSRPDSTTVSRRGFGTAASVRTPVGGVRNYMRFCRIM